MNNPDRIITKTDLTPGTVYQFRYRIKNIYGFSQYSPVAEIFAAKVPSIITTPTLSYVDKSVKIKWTAPNNNFNTIQGYKIEILEVDGVSWFED